MKTSPAGVALIQRFESLELRAYQCAAGAWTIGWGHTGPDVYRGLCVTRERAEELLAQDLARFERAVSEAVTVPLQQHQFDALVSFAFNVGERAFRESTLLRLLNAGDYAGADNQFPRWNKSRGRSLLGLTRRRAAERALFVGASA